MTVADTLTRIEFERVAPVVGARVSGISIDQEYDEAVAQKLQNALHEYGVLFFDFGRTVTEAEQRKFGILFGDVEPSYGLTTGKDSGGLIDAGLQPLKEYRTNIWHSDGSCFEKPPQGALLAAVESPQLGGGTMFASMAAAYEGLSSHFQRLLDGLDVLHSTMRTPFVREKSQAVHPAVIRDPVTGKKLLFINPTYSEKFVGLSERENDFLMLYLAEHVNQPEFHCTMTWKTGAMAVWENRVTQHRAVDSFIGQRKLRRVTLLGDKPVR